MKAKLLLWLWIAALALPFSLSAASHQLLGWNNLGMHEPPRAGRGDEGELVSRRGHPDLAL